ncbi:hypothetical protein RND71_032075 [Anisodus tanguticus]|uniref:BHLH domain-containing protein n=1 Tax=Anisodus tanguticus TaxID=243964 RepID=A0AAE1RCY2_9SOLA|nr:hypothetical protein RND71_032075 [Anisodus tanguticus]
MMQHKRSSISLEHSTGLTSLTPKRLKADMPISSKEKKEKFGERIVALQQLVSPYGKTDTASVLLEAMGYIKFLHEQVKIFFRPGHCWGLWTSYWIFTIYSCFTVLSVLNYMRENVLRIEVIVEDHVSVLSAPYLGSMPMTQESQPYNLRGQGLCLVPVSYTVGVASSNGADIWAPIKTSQKF